MEQNVQRIPEPEYMDLEHEAAAYASADFRDVNAAFTSRLLELADAARPCRVIDLGAGPGDIALRIAAARPSWPIMALDASRPMLQAARRSICNAQLHNPPVCIQGDAKAIPFVDGQFDVVCSNSILHHVQDAVRFWEESARVLAPGGLIFLRDLARPPSETVAAETVRRYAADETPLLQEEYYRSLLAAYTPAEVARQLSAAGLKGLRVAMVTDRHLDVWGHLSRR